MQHAVCHAPRQRSRPPAAVAAGFGRGNQSASLSTIVGTAGGSRLRRGNTHADDVHVSELARTIHPAGRGRKRRTRTGGEFKRTGHRLGDREMARSYDGEAITGTRTLKLLEPPEQAASSARRPPSVPGAIKRVDGQTCSDRLSPCG